MIKVKTHIGQSAIQRSLTESFINQFNLCKSPNYFDGSFFRFNDQSDDQLLELVKPFQKLPPFQGCTAEGWIQVSPQILSLAVLGALVSSAILTETAIEPVTGNKEVDPL